MRMLKILLHTLKPWNSYYFHSFLWNWIIIYFCDYLAKYWKIKSYNTVQNKISHYIELTKPRITMLVLVTAYLGYYLGLRSQDNHMATIESWVVLFYLLLGTWATSAAAAVLNQVIERKQDSKMMRTKNRPLVRGSIQWLSAIIFGVVLGLCGFTVLYYLINPITAWISAATIFLYIFVSCFLPVFQVLFSFRQ